MADSNVIDDFGFIWLDATNDDSPANRDTKALLRQLVRGRLQTCIDLEQCIDYILTTPTTRKIFLIVSSILGEKAVPFLHDWLQIHTIYVYCGDRPRAEQWTTSHKKISAIFTKKQELLNQVAGDVGACDKDRQIPMSVFHLSEKQNSLQNLTKESVDFMWYQFILDVLRMMAKYGDSKVEMIAECRAKYHQDEVEKRKIDDFERNYVATKAFWWYTFDSCIYRLLNAALRTQDTEIIFKFRLFIQDLHNQINVLYQEYLLKHSAKPNHELIVYRGQRLAMNEIDLLKRSEKQLISMNSFLSATTTKELAEIFADTSDQINESSPLQSVLFIIKVCDMTKDTTPFAFIQEFSCCRDEEEVLFSIGAIFNVQSVKREGQIWHVHLQLSKQQNDVCQSVIHHMKTQIGREPGPLTLGWFLYRMSKFDKAERYVEFILKTFPPKHKVIGDAHNLLGLICKDTKRLEDAVEHYQKALNVYSCHGSQNSPNVIAAHYNLALAYLALGDNRNADDHQKLAEGKLINSSQTDNSLLIAQTDSLKGKLQAVYGDYTSACEHLEAALEKKQKKLPENHPSIASTLNDLGIIHEKIGNDQKALDYFHRVLKICYQSLSSNNSDFAEYHANAGRIHFKQKEYKLALKQFKSALDITKDFMREKREEFDALLAHIAETEEKLKRSQSVP